MRMGRQALVRAVGRGSREQVVVLDAVMMSETWEESMGEKAVREGGAGGLGGGRGLGWWWWRSCQRRQSGSC